MPLYTPAAAIRMNWRTVFGALSVKNSIVIGPSLVSSTARYDAELRDVSVTNGSGGVSRIVTRRISTRSVASPAASTGVAEIFEQHLHAVRDVAEDAVLAVERRLIGQHDEELRAGAVGLARDGHRSHRAPASSSARGASSFTAFRPPLP